MKNYWNALRQFDRNINLFLLYWAMIAFAYFGVIGVLMNLYLLRLGYETEFIGMVIGLGQLVWAVFALPAGVIGSRIGTKRAMVIGMMFSAVGTALMLAAEALPPAQHPLGLVLGWMLSWVGAALGAVNGVPYLMSVTNEQTRGFAFSAQQTVMAVASFAGAIAAGVMPGFFARQINRTLEDPVPYRMALMMAPLAYFVAAVAFSRARQVAPPAQQTQTAGTNKAPVGIFLFFGLMIGLQAYSEGSVRAFFNVYLDTNLSASTEAIGGIFGISQLVLIVVSLILPAALARWGAKGSLTVTTFGMALFVLLLALVPTRLGASLAYVGTSAMLIMVATARGIYGQESVAPRWRTMISAVSTVGLALGWSLSAWSGGILVKNAGFQSLFLLGALFALLSTGMLVVQGRRFGASSTIPEEPEQALIAVTGETEEAC